VKTVLGGADHTLNRVEVVGTASSVMLDAMKASLNAKNAWNSGLFAITIHLMAKIYSQNIRSQNH
jgi:hypothetical protein